MRNLILVILILILISMALLAACGGTDDRAATARIEITALAGPACPVETDPPSPECAPRPVDNAVFAVTDADGNEVARGATGAHGRVVLEVPVGELTVVPQPVEGLLGTAAALVVSVGDGQTLQVTADYDTGIR